MPGPCRVEVGLNAFSPLSESMIRFVYRADHTGIRKLIASGESPDAVDSDGRTALVHAVLATPPVNEVIAALIGAGANANLRDKGQGWAALAFAARDCPVEVCRMLVDAGAEINATDVFGNTALWRAVMARKHENIAFLLSRGADADRSNQKGVSPRQLARTMGWEINRAVD
jgi:uncharacterized protein